VGIDNRNSAWITRVAWITGVAMTATFLVAHLGTQPAMRVLFDNVQWTVTQFGAAWLAWLGYRSNPDADRITRRWFLWGLLTYVIGQLLWDVQVYIGWTPFPAPSDLFYAACGPCIVIGLWCALRRRVTAARARLLLLDMIILTVQTLAIILVVYMANTSDIPVLQLLQLAVYPIVMFGSAIVAVMMALSLGLRLDWRWALLPCSLVLTGIAWMRWNIISIAHMPESGSWLSYLFATASLLRGFGVAHWDVDSAQPITTQRRDAVMFLLMPLVPVIAAVTTVFLVWDDDDLPRMLRVAVMVGSAVVVLLAVVRQAYALTERERLLQAERSVVEKDQQYRVLAQRFELATSAARLGIWDIDLTQPRTSLWEPRMYELFGYDPATKLSAYDIWDQAIHPDDTLRAQQQFITAINGEYDFALEFRVVTLAGEVRYLEAYGMVLHDNAGKPARVTGVTWNVTEKVMARRALANSEAELSAIFENSVLGIVLIDEQRKILRNNRAARQLLGYTEAEAAQARAEDIIHPEESALSLQLFGALATGQRDSYQQEKRYLRRDGTALWVRVTVYPVTLEAAHDYVVLIEDVSQRRITEEQLHEVQLSELRAREEFAFRLLNAQEQERQRIAYELHDGLSQSLSVIKNRAQLALGQLPATADVTSAEVEAQLQGILRVTTDAIAEARGLAHNLRPLHIEQLGLTAALAQLLGQFAEASGIKTESRLEPIDDAIPSNQVTHIYRLLQESLNNIGKHAQATGVNVMIERDVHAVRIAINDDGRGFDVGLASQAGGLGLQSMTERAHMLGGQITLSSGASGSSVVITIPIIEPHFIDELSADASLPA
jgi:PAS domain S-box-containing protein